METSRTPLLKATLLVLLFSSLVVVANAKIYPPDDLSKLHLGYMNGSYTNITGADYTYFDSLQRINNVWFINGESFTGLETETEESALVLAILAFVLAVSLGSFAVLMIQRRRNS